MSEVKDTKIVHLADDIQKVQTKTNFYLSEYGSEGAFHMAREVGFDNIGETILDVIIGDPINNAASFPPSENDF